ncbi:hypothetical protein BU26DRAFT_71702 [Trematosphaeria pertusa]|uniref:Uncharacterized protein n=1 Tax=Trematosphaeria pertusa TaxID=390896 RepID=A0A6A6I5H6_9PLEO|nr:uncharacterized protein BU26DRAFT_71702 [Trematosphaeria pertusa]KAF2245601.1 hypothetical protein BU26DRAFT_71702 [Trematosphaeria pertusa]
MRHPTEDVSWRRRCLMHSRQTARGEGTTSISLSLEMKAVNVADAVSRHGLMISCHGGFSRSIVSRCSSRARLLDCVSFPHVVSLVFAFFCRHREPPSRFSAAGIQPSPTDASTSRWPRSALRGSIWARTKNGDAHVVHGELEHRRLLGFDGSERSDKSQR